MARRLAVFLAGFDPAERWIRRWPWLPPLAGVALLLLWLALADGASILGPIVATDLEQHRANVPLPVPNGTFHIQQSFFARWDGLQEIEIIFARGGEPVGGQGGRLSLQLLDEDLNLLEAQELQSHTLAHNQTYTFRFPKQSRSAGQRYLLRLTGNRDNRVTVWGYSLDSYAAGKLSLVGDGEQAGTPPLTAKDLRLVTRYRLQWMDALMALGTMLWRQGALLLVALAFLPLPGALLLSFFGRRGWRWQPAAWWGTAYALGVTGWALLWAGFSWVGLRWAGWSLWLFFAAGWSALLLKAFLGWRRRGAGAGRPSIVGDLGGKEPNRLQPVGRRRWRQGVVPALLLAAIAIRLIAVRDLSFPPWVDSSRHALITAAMAEQGRTLTEYAPFLPVDRAPYHFGFHTLSASLLLMTGWSLPRLLLFMGQLLNGLIPLVIYAAAWLMTRRRGISLLAAFLVAFPFFFPAYYATWGRLTQLTAMFLLPILVAFTWLLIRGGRRWRNAWWITGLLASGLFLVHIRVFLFYLPYVVLVWLASFGRNGRRLLAAAALSLALVAPRILQLGALTEPTRIFDNNIANYNAFPTSYVQVGWERQFIGAALAGLLLVMASGLRRQRWTSLPLLLAGWVGMMFLLLSGERLGLPETSLVNLNSMYITLFLPLSLFLAVIAGNVSRWWRRSHWLLRWLGGIAAGVTLAAGLLFGIRQQVSILNPQTILARHEDLAGLEWAADNLPSSAVVAVNSWLWLGQTWAGSDGGAWVVPMSGLASTTPPIDYIYSTALRAFVSDFNAGASNRSDWASAASADWLRGQGVSHVYIGSRGGFLEPATLVQNPAMRLIYSQDGVFIFELASP